MYIKVKVNPRAKKEKLKQTKENYFEISVKEEAKNNLANRRIIEIIAQFFDLPKGKVRIINGHQSPNKLLIIDKNV